MTETKQRLLAILLSTALLFAVASAGARADEVGLVLALTGDVSALQPDGRMRVLANGSPVHGGDLIRTAADAAVQIRFSDGALAMLPGATQYRIDEYRPESAGANARAFTRLLKGGLRTLSGLIGRIDRAQYRVDTPIATVGIRGTDYALRLCQDDCVPGLANGLYLSVFDGAIVATNDAGEHVVQRGESAFIPDRAAPAQRRDDNPIDFGELQPWRGAGTSTADSFDDERVANELRMEFRATDLVQCVD